MKLILIGIQGSGKSTQGNILADKLNIPYLSTGHIFRELSKEKSPAGRYIKETVNAGYLVPDEKVLEIVSEYLSRPEYEKGYVLDGFPRTVAQAEAFKNGINKVIYLRVSDKEALWRISGREDVREDETLHALRKRIDLFHRFTEPVLDYYKQKSVLVEVDGEQSVEEIHKQIMEAIEK
jgi:adenylate kinase